MSEMAFVGYFGGLVRVVIRIYARVPSPEPRPRLRPPCGSQRPLGSEFNTIIILIIRVAIWTCIWPGKSKLATVATCT